MTLADHHYKWATALLATLNAAWMAGEVDASDLPMNRINGIVTQGVDAWLSQLYPSRCAPDRVSYSTPSVNALLDEAEAAGRAYSAALAGGAQ